MKYTKVQGVSWMPCVGYENQLLINLTKANYLKGDKMSTFSGHETHSASELRNILGQWEPPKDLKGVVSELTGAIMILCNEVDRLDGRIDDLEEFAKEARLERDSKITNP